MTPVFITLTLFIIILMRACNFGASFYSKRGQMYYRREIVSHFKATASKTRSAASFAEFCVTG
jgi:hypothetical protein